MIENKLTELSAAIKNEDAGPNYYFTDAGLVKSKIFAEQSTRPMTPTLTQMLLLEMRNNRDNKSIMVEFFEANVRVFGHTQKPGLSQSY